MKRMFNTIGIIGIVFIVLAVFFLLLIILDKNTYQQLLNGSSLPVFFLGWGAACILTWWAKYLNDKNEKSKIKNKKS